MLVILQQRSVREILVLLQEISVTERQNQQEDPVNKQNGMYE